MEKKELFVAAIILKKNKGNQPNEKAKKIKEEYIKEKRQRKNEFRFVDPDEIPTLQPIQKTTFQQIFSTDFPTDPRILVASGYNPQHKGKEAIRQFFSS